MPFLSRFEDRGHANVYNLYRPTVPKPVIDIVLGYLNEETEKSEWQTAVDVGCGNGQCTNVLAQYFQNVYGFDISSAQITEANASDHPINVHYHVSAAEDLSSVPSNSVQLITSSTAAHWFEFPKFFAEVNRVLVSKGVVALFSYFLSHPSNTQKPDDQRLAQFVRDVFYDPLLHRYQDVERIATVEQHYKTIKFPDDYHYVHRDNITVRKVTNGSRVIGHIKSWSHYQALLKNNREEAEVFMDSVEKKFRDILGVEDLSQIDLFYNSEYFIAMARKP